MHAERIGRIRLDASGKSESAASANLSAVVRPGLRAGHSQPAQRRYLIRRGIVEAEARAITVFRLGCSGLFRVTTAGHF